MQYMLSSPYFITKHEGKSAFHNIRSSISQIIFVFIVIVHYCPFILAIYESSGKKLPLALFTSPIYQHIWKFSPMMSTSRKV